LQARLVVEPGRDGKPVLAQVAEALRAAFGFARQKLAQPVRASEIIRVMQQVAGVRAALLNNLYLGDTPGWRNELTALPAQFQALPDKPIASYGAELLLLNLALTDLELAR